MTKIPDGLRDHIDEQQRIAITILGLFEGLRVLHMHGEAPCAIRAMIDAGWKLADELSDELDSITIKAKLTEAGSCAGA